MKSFFWSLIYIFCAWSLFFIGRGVDNIDIMSERYKRALDAGANAAASYRAYDTREMLDRQSTGFGTGLDDSRNVPVDREAALQWFYRLFFRNLGVSDASAKNELKKYIPMKAMICYDRLMIAGMTDNWFTYTPSGEKEYIIKYRGKDYKFTLSDQLYDIEKKIWIRADDIGLRPEDRKGLLTEYIAGELNTFLCNRINKTSGNHYEIRFSLKDTNEEKLSGINGVNFLVFCEGMPIPALNPYKSQCFYAYSVGGSELVRTE